MRNEGLGNTTLSGLEFAGSTLKGYAQSDTADGTTRVTRFDSVDRALLDGTARLARNVLDLERVAGRLFEYQAEGADEAPGFIPEEVRESSFIESSNGHIRHLTHWNKRLEDVINAFNS